MDKHNKTNLKILTIKEKTKLKIGKWFIFGSLFIPTTTFYLGFYDTNPKFPATISFITTKSPPKYIYKGMLFLSYYFIFPVLWKFKNKYIKIVLISIILSGILGTLIFIPGKTKIFDNLHILFSTIFTIGLMYLMQILEVKNIYKISIYINLTIFCVCLILQETKLQNNYTNKLIMVLTQYIVFYTYIFGLTSGIQ